MSTTYSRSNWQWSSDKELFRTCTSTGWGIISLFARYVTGHNALTTRLRRARFESCTMANDLWYANYCIHHAATFPICASPAWEGITCLAMNDDASWSLCHSESLTTVYFHGRSSYPSWGCAASLFFCSSSTRFHATNTVSWYSISDLSVEQ